MLNIVSSLLFRLKKSKLFWIMLGVCFAVPVLSLVLNEIILEVAEIFVGSTAGLGLEMVTYMSLTELVSLSSTVCLFALLCVSIFLCKEYNDGTIRNTILSNKKRTDLYVAYAIVALIIGGSYLVAYFASTMLVLGIPFGFGSATPAEVITSCACSLLLGLLSLVFVISCVLMFMFATGKQASALVFPLLITLFLPGVITIVVDVAAFVIEMIKVGSENAFVDWSNAAYSWIPLYNAMLFDASDVDGALVGKISMYYVAFSGLFVWLGLRASKKDLK